MRTVDGIKVKVKIKVRGRVKVEVKVKVNVKVEVKASLSLGFFIHSELIKLVSGAKTGGFFLKTCQAKPDSARN